MHVEADNRRCLAVGRDRLSQNRQVVELDRRRATVGHAARTFLVRAVRAMKEVIGTHHRDVNAGIVNAERAAAVIPEIRVAVRRVGTRLRAVDTVVDHQGIGKNIKLLYRPQVVEGDFVICETEARQHSAIDRDVTGAAEQNAVVTVLNVTVLIATLGDEI